MPRRKCRPRQNLLTVLVLVLAGGADLGQRTLRCREQHKEEFFDGQLSSRNPYHLVIREYSKLRA